MHKQSVLLKVTTERAPRVDERTIKVDTTPSGFRLLWLVFGFGEKPDVPAAPRLHPEAVESDPDEASFFWPRDAGSIIETAPVGMAAAAICVYDAKRRGGPGLLLDTPAARR